jgi:hypothetical protein
VRVAWIAEILHDRRTAIEEVVRGSGVVMPAGVVESLISGVFW